MIKTYHLQDGGKITATCPEEFLTLLRQGSRFDSECSDHEFMRHFAHRYKLMHGEDVDTSTPTSFLNTLCRYGYITLIE